MILAASSIEYPLFFKNMWLPLDIQNTSKQWCAEDSGFPGCTPLLQGPENDATFFLLKLLQLKSKLQTAFPVVAFFSLKQNGANSDDRMRSRAGVYNSDNLWSSYYLAGDLSSFFGPHPSRMYILAV